MKSIEELRSEPENPWVAGVRQFHKEKLPFSVLPDTPRLPSDADIVTEIGSNFEEFAEWTKGLATKDMVLIADAIGDTIYTLIGTALKFGIDISAVFSDIQRSNMDKLPAAPGTMGRKTATGGSMKPFNWVGPRIHAILAHQNKDVVEF